MDNCLYGSSILLFMVQYYFITCLGMPLSNITDQQSLLAVKSHITNDPYTNPLTNNWTIGTNVCTWIGISCSVRRQRVTALTLPDLSLIGTIPPHIGNLSFLVSLNLRNNSFQGNLPPEIGHLRRLKSINLNFNNFSGPIPKSFGTLRSLKQLLLANNSLSGTIPLSLLNLSMLENLRFQDNFIEGSIPEEIGNLANLRTIDISSNRLRGVIPATLFNISSLENIALARNALSGSLPVSMCNQLPSLVGLFLGLNMFSGPIPSNIGRCQELLFLALSGNTFTGSIPTSIGNLTMLKFLFLGANTFTGEIPQEISRLQSLERLGIERSGLFGRIPPSIFNVTSLVRLTLSQLKLEGVIPQEVGKLRNLEMLVLDDNGLSGPIPTVLFNISTLRVLSLQDNQFSGNLPSTLGNSLPNLEGLYLGNNDLTGIIPDSLSNASMLIDLILTINRLSGTIPNTLGNLERLERLFMQGNNLTSEVSSTQELGFLSSLTRCRNLRLLWVSHNPLNGILPASIGNFSTSLEDIFARRCGIMGEIPNEIGNISNLAFLDLDINDFTGVVPTTMKSLEKLQYLFLSTNRLNGFIPNDLCYLPNLGTLSLYKNELSGPIPPCLGNISSLRNLYLNSNRLTSSIPASLWNLKDLLTFTCFSNSLSGHIPEEIGNLISAFLIDLSMNQFTNNIPSAIGMLKDLQSLKLEHNRFEGDIPESFGGLVSLEFLDLSFNNLSGVIPKSLEALLYLKYFNVSFNKLRGKIPTGGPFSNFTKQSFLPNEALCGGAPQLQLPPCATIALPKSKMKRILLYTLLPIGSTLVVLALALLYIRSRSKRKPPTPNDLLPAVALERISCHELFQATNGLGDSNLVGMGSFSSVYKGTLSNGMIVAIKVFNLLEEGAFRSFDTECDMLRNIRHRNLTKVISSCSNLDFKALVLEYMPNGNLDKWLYSHNYFLDMLQRLDIMIDVACALDYLHHGHSIPVVHCDLKPSNILLDRNMVAHVSDFGISKFLCDEESMIQTKTLATFGYMAPEYGLEGSISTRCDIYSYGILLMETFTRTKPTDEMFVGDKSLKSWVKESLPTAILEVVDANLLRSEEGNLTAKLQCVSAILELAMRSCAELPQDRINMRDALAVLKKTRHQLLSDQQGT